MMRRNAWKIRRSVKHIEGAWVRCWSDGVVWAGSKRNSRAAMNEVRAALEAAGYDCQCNGKPGTSGEFLIEVTMLPEKKQKRASPAVLRRLRRKIENEALAKEARMWRKPGRIEYTTPARIVRGGLPGLGKRR